MVHARCERAVGLLTLKVGGDGAGDMTAWVEFMALLSLNTLCYAFLGAGPSLNILCPVQCIVCLFEGALSGVGISSSVPPPRFVALLLTWMCVVRGWCSGRDVCSQGASRDDHLDPPLPDYHGDSRPRIIVECPLLCTLIKRAAYP
eukprot:1976843-Rhodomonas_salina.1